jgi:hypothetical protein
MVLSDLSIAWWGGWNNRLQQNPIVHAILHHLVFFFGSLIPGLEDMMVRQNPETPPTPENNQVPTDQQPAPEGPNTDPSTFSPSTAPPSSAEKIPAPGLNAERKESGVSTSPSINGHDTGSSSTKGKERMVVAE